MKQHIVNFLRLLGLTSQAKSAPLMASTSFDHIIFVAPKYDDLTLVMASWLESIAQETGANCIRLFGDQADRKDLRQTLKSIRNTKFLLIFFGHGEPAALLTGTPEASGLDTTPYHKKLLVENDIDGEHRLELIAYCCSAAKDLGFKIRNKGNGNRFLGYNDLIPFELHPQYRDAFREPMSTLVRTVIEGGSVDLETRDHLESAYETELHEWLYGKSSQKDKAMLVCMFLEEHINNLSKEI
jgi:hypothetical protein